MQICKEFNIVLLIIDDLLTLSKPPLANTCMSPCVCTGTEYLRLRMAHVNTPVVVNVADLLKQIQSASSQNRQSQNVVIRGQGPVATQHNSVLLGGTSSNTSATPPTTIQGSVNYNYKVKIINPAKKSDVIIRHLNSFTGKFDTVMALCLQLIEAFSDLSRFRRSPSISGPPGLSTARSCAVNGPPGPNLTAVFGPSLRCMVPQVL